MQHKHARSAHTQNSDAQRVKRQKRAHSAPFAFYPDNWTTARTFDKNVSLLKATRADRGGPQRIVKKLLKVEPNSANDPRPLEIRCLALLPRCNRIVHALTCVAFEGPDIGIALFEYYPLGDLAMWKASMFDQRNLKPVPESYIWRFFMQMAQALAFIQGQLGPEPGRRNIILHRDIKPKNILVVDLGTTYPSFKLHDFGCATTWRKDRHFMHSWCGTFDWQPPENPQINTAAAEVWALGACVHFLATGQKTIVNTEIYETAYLKDTKGLPEDSSDRQNYSSAERYFAAKVPRRVIPINIDAQTQLSRKIPNLGVTNFQYSDELNDWMVDCLQYDPSARPNVEDLVLDMGEVAQEMLKQMGGAAAMVDMEVTF
jgi:serine/threonine protein kinase